MKLSRQETLNEFYYFYLHQLIVDNTLKVNHLSVMIGMNAEMHAAPKHAHQVKSQGSVDLLQADLCPFVLAPSPLAPSSTGPSGRRCEWCC